MKRKLVYHKKQRDLLFYRLRIPLSGKYCSSCAYEIESWCSLKRKYEIDYHELLCGQDIYGDSKWWEVDKNYMYVAKEDITI